MKMKKMVWITLGFLSLGLGAVGAVLPILPSVPFLLLAAFSFGKSSEKLHAWFVSTKLYQNNLDSYVKGEGMMNRTKAKIIITVTLLMGFGFFMMLRKSLYFPCAILGAVWLLHILYFGIAVKTRKEEDDKSEEVYYTVEN